MGIGGSGSNQASWLLDGGEGPLGPCWMLGKVSYMEGLALLWKLPWLLGDAGTKSGDPVSSCGVHGAKPGEARSVSEETEGLLSGEPLAPLFLNAMKRRSTSAFIIRCGTT